MIIILIRTLIIYAFVLVMLRMMGKAELSQLEPFQLVVTIMIADLAAIAIADPEIPILYGFAALAGLLIMQVVISYLSMKSDRFRSFVCGKPSILIEDGKVNEKELKKLRISINDLTQQLRIKDFPSIADVKYAVMEANGDLSVIPKPSKKNLTPEDINLSMKQETMPMMVIADGVLYKENLQRFQETEESILNKIKKDGAKSLSDVLFAYFDENKAFHIYQKDKYAGGDSN